jgi:hypothetical protein
VTRDRAGSLFRIRMGKGLFNGEVPMAGRNDASLDRHVE